MSLYPRGSGQTGIIKDDNETIYYTLHLTQISNLYLEIFECVDKVKIYSGNNFEEIKNKNISTGINGEILRESNSQEQIIYWNHLPAGSFYIAISNNLEK